MFKDAFAVAWLVERVPCGEDRYAIIGMVGNRLFYVAYTMRDDKIRIISPRGAEPYEIPPEHDWERFDAMTEAQRHAAALSDPDAQPVTPDNEKRMKRTPQVKVIRRAPGISQEEFAS